MKVVQLNDIYDLSQGVVLARLKNDLWNPVQVLQTRNLNNLEVSGEVELVRLGPIRKVRRLHPHDILINMKSIPVYASVVSEQYAGSIASSNIAILTAQADVAETLDPFYLVGLLRSSYMNRVLSSHMGGESISSFNLRSLRTLPVPVPPYDKQLAFGRAFRALERYVHLTQELVEAHTERLEVELSSYLGGLHDT